MRLREVAGGSWLSLSVCVCLCGRLRGLREVTGGYGRLQEVTGGSWLSLSRSLLCPTQSKLKTWYVACTGFCLFFSVFVSVCVCKFLSFGGPSAGY